MLDNTGNSVKQFSFTGSVAFFSQTLCFQQLLRCLKVSLISYTAMVEKASGPLYIDPRGLSHSIVLGKTSQIYCQCEPSSFLKNLFLSTS